MSQPPRLWPLYVGGFLGPFGGAMVSTMLPELARGLDTTVPTAATAVTWYMIPFSVLMLLSGTLGARLGLARAIRLAFVAYAVASLVCVLAAGPVTFLGGRALQGAANAFTTPLLLALLAELVPQERLGRAFGTYAAAGAAGQAFAPLVGGVAAGIDYRWAFALSALVALALVALAPSSRAHAPSAPARWSALRNAGLARASLTGFAGQFTATSVMLLAAYLASARFDLSPALRGLLVAAFGVAGLLSGRAFGRLADRVGLVRSGAGALLLAGLAALAVVASPAVVLLVAAVALAGAAATGARVLTNGLAVLSTPSNAAGATSVALSASFVGSAIAPSILALAHGAPLAAGVVPLAVCAFAALVVVRAPAAPPVP